jgi:tetratricopeptide (TPR) repeat protein
VGSGFQPAAGFLAGLLAVCAIVPFAASIGGPFVFDDLALTSDPAVVNTSGWIDCLRLTQTRPLTWLTFWLNWQVAGTHTWAWHAVNLALHVACVLLVFDVLRRLISERAAMFAAAIFAVHPIMTEPVAYIFARATLLAALFSLLAIRSWLDDRPWLATLWFALAMLAKEEAAAVPIALAILRPQHWRAIGAMLGIALALGARAVWATTVVPSGGGPQAGISALDYFAAQGVVILRYLEMAAVPWGFTIDAEIAQPAWWISVLAWIAIALLAWRSRWFLIGLVLLLPSSSIFPAQDLAADRRMYLPMVVFCALAALLLNRAPRLGRIGLIIAFLAISIRYSLLWRDPRALWAEARERAPNKTRPCLQYSRYVSTGEALDILAACAHADADVENEKGRRFMESRRPDLALTAFGTALAQRPTDARAINNRGVALAALGQMEAARADFERALKIDPCQRDARVNLEQLGISVPQPPACPHLPPPAELQDR